MTSKRGGKKVWRRDNYCKGYKQQQGTSSISGALFLISEGEAAGTALRPPPSTQPLTLHVNKRNDVVIEKCDLITP